MLNMPTEPKKLLYRDLINMYDEIIPLTTLEK